MTSITSSSSAWNNTIPNKRQINHKNIVIVEDHIELLNKSNSSISSKMQKMPSTISSSCSTSSSSSVSSSCSTESEEATRSSSSSWLSSEAEIISPMMATTKNLVASAIRTPKQQKNHIPSSSVSSLNDDNNTTATIIDPWSVYDRIVCLNLRERTDRYEHMVNEFQKIDILNRVEFVINDRSPFGGTYGCFESHWNAIRNAYKDGLQNLLIFEDDVQFKNGYQDIINDCYTFINNNVVNDWEFLCLNGAIYYGVEASSSQTSNIIMGKSLMAHAVCISRIGMKTFLKQYPKPIGSYNVDFAYSQCFHKSYVHIKYNTIIQLMDTFSSDNPWDEITRVTNVDTIIHQYIQEVYMPYYFNMISFINVLFYYILPYQYRPWLISNHKCMIPRHDILIYKNNKQQSFPWKDYYLAKIVIDILGAIIFIRLYCIGLLPRNDIKFIYNIIYTLFAAQQCNNETKTHQSKKIQ